MKINFGKFLHTLELIGPPLLTAVGVPALAIPLVVHGIQLAEQHPGTGAEKKALALDAVATGIATYNSLAPAAPLDPALTVLVAGGIDTVVGTINAVHRQPLGLAPAGV